MSLTVKIRKFAAAALAVPLAAAAGMLAASGPAHAAAGAVQPAVTDTWGFAGYEASASAGTDFTHFSTLVGMGTQYSPANPALPSLGGVLPAAGSGWHSVSGAPAQALALVEAAGVQFGTHGRQAASLGVVRSGNRNDVVAVITAPGGSLDYAVLASYPMADTIDLDLLHDATAAYTFRSHREGAGTVTFSTEDIHTGISSVKTIDSSTIGEHGVSIRSPFHTASGGILSGARQAQGGVAALPPLPAADTSAGMVARLAHLHLDANADSGEVFSEGFQSGAAWDVIPYAASVSNRTVAGPAVFTSDHESVLELAPQH